MLRLMPDAMALLALPLRAEIRAALANADAAFLLLACGVLAVVGEFLRPGMVVPGVTGACAILLAGWAFAAAGASVAAIHGAVAIGAGVPVTAALAIALLLARRARRNKTDCSRSFPVG